MPVTAKLSKKFYDKLGEEVASELVDWFNQVDATYRTDLRQLNDLNFSRFEARLEQRTSELAARINQKIVELEAGMNQKMAALEARMEAGFAELRNALDVLRKDLDVRLAGFEARITRWMFVFWLGTIGTLIALIKF